MFFIMFFVFCIFRIEADKFRFKDLFEECFLWSEEEVDKYTKWGQEENHENTQNLESQRMSPIGNITNDPDNETKPDNKEIDDDTTEQNIRIYPGDEVEGYIHEIDYR